MSTTYSGRGLHGQVVAVVGRRIVTGALPENATIDLIGLEVELDVSRTVVREALKVLAAKGLVDARQKRGTFVRPRTAWNLLDPDLIRWEFEHRGAAEMLTQLTEVRLIFEPAAAALAAGRVTDADLTELDAALRQMEVAVTSAEIMAADVRFHRSLLAATGNELLARLEVVTSTVLAERDRIMHDVNPPADLVPSHRAVLDAIRDGDALGASELVRVLLTTAAEDVNRTIALRKAPAPADGRRADGRRAEGRQAAQLPVSTSRVSP